MPTCPEISVLLPVRNARPYLAEALADLCAQEAVDLEILAVDDGSTDGSQDVLRGHAAADRRIRLFRSGGRGAAHALNLALSRARAPWIGHMEADDRCERSRFLRLRAALQVDGGLEGVTSRAVAFGGTTSGMQRYLDWQNSLLAPEEHRRQRFVEIPALHQSGLYRKEWLRALGGYRDDPRWPLDIDFWMRALAGPGRIGKVPEVLYRWRQHPRQSTRTSERHGQGALRRCKAYYFLRGPGRGKPLDLYSVNRTLEGWCAALAEAGARDLQAYSWRPDREPLPPGRDRAVRLFAYGMPQTRERVARCAALRGPPWDWFVG
jgi:glycosyltransferase involved in cell wall biosynthesis